MITGLLILLGVSSALGVYPLLKDVVYDPKDFDVLYHSAKGPFQETWSFTRTVRVTAFILASQVDLCGANNTYHENITLKVSKVEKGVWTLITEARFQGEVGHGQEIYVSLYNSTTHTYPQFYTSSVFNYALRVDFGSKTGIYPWHTARSFSSACATSASAPGHVIGIEYTW